MSFTIGSAPPGMGPRGVLEDFGSKDVEGGAMLEDSIGEDRRVHETPQMAQRRDRNTHKLNEVGQAGRDSDEDDGQYVP